jgi:hypothetical protein
MDFFCVHSPILVCLEINLKVHTSAPDRAIWSFSLYKCPDIDLSIGPRRIGTFRICGSICDSLRYQSLIGNRKQPTQMAHLACRYDSHIFVFRPNGLLYLPALDSQKYVV